MSNLGGYQTITRIAKKLGGPEIFVGTLILGGYGVVRLTEAGTKFVIRKAKRAFDSKFIGLEITVNREGTDNQGLTFKPGDILTILEKDGDSLLIERQGDANSPYFVSEEFLRKISDLDRKNRGSVKSL